MTWGALSLRDQEGTDEAVVRRAHAAHARWSAMATWPGAMIASLRDQQHRAHEHHLAAFHPAAERLMILLDGAAVGRLVVDRAADPWHLVDLALVAEAQGSGIGTAVLERLLGDAAHRGVGVILEVGVDNPQAEAFYRRLGFADTGGGDALQKRLRWQAR